MQAIRNFSVIPGADIEKLQKAVIDSKDSFQALKFYKAAHGADLEKLQKVVLNDPSALSNTILDFAKIRNTNTKALENKFLRLNPDGVALLDFAKEVPGADTNKLEKHLLSSIAHPKIIYNFAKLEGADTKKLAEALMTSLLSKDSNYNYDKVKNNMKYVTFFARNIPGAPIEELQNIILEKAQAYETVEFASNVKGADIKKLQDRVIELGDPQEMENFANEVKGANRKLLMDAAEKQRYLGYPNAKPF
jgi:hypothetical protein